MRVTFLGTGTSHGIPVIACGCPVCLSDDSRNKRLRPSVYVQSNATSILVDVTPDFRQQALRAGIQRIDAVFLTHTHADHIMGLDDVRVFTQRSGRKMPVYGSAETIRNIQRIFPYACTDTPAWPSLPRFDLRVVRPGEEFLLGDMTASAVSLPHGWMEVYGYVFEKRLAYLTDCNDVPDPVVQSLRGVPVLVLDALRPRPHPTHLTIEQAVAVAGRVEAGLTLLTHISHETEHASVEKTLPAGVRLAWDGMRVEITNGAVEEI